MSFFRDVYIAIGRKKHSNQHGHLVTFVAVDTDEIVFQLCRDPRRESTWRRVRKIARRHKWKIVRRSIDIEIKAGDRLDELLSS